MKIKFLNTGIRHQQTCPTADLDKDSSERRKILKVDALLLTELRIPLKMSSGLLDNLFRLVLTSLQKAVKAVKSMEFLGGAVSQDMFLHIFSASLLKTLSCPALL